MHIINRSFLKLALLPTALYARMGVDTTQLTAILTTKLILDDRRPQPITKMSGNTRKKPVSMATLGTMLMSVAMGAFFLVCFLFGSDIITHLTFYFSFFFVFLSLTLITDFTSVLIDVRDNFILLPKPVSDKTIVVARLLHIFIHLCKIVLPMSLPGTIFLGINQNIYGALLLLFLIFLLAGFAIFFINAAYIAVLKFTTPQRFQAIIMYVQIAFAIMLYGSYQVFPRLIKSFGGDDFQINNYSGILFLPLYWLANSWKALFQFGGTLTEIITGVAGILFPLFCIWVVVKYLAPSFNRKLSLLSTSNSGPKKQSLTVRKEKKGYIHFFSRLLTSGPVEKASFVFTWKMMGHSREFKLKVYPAIGYILVYVVFIFLSNKDINLSKLWDGDSDVKLILLSTLYLSIFLVIMAIGQVSFSDKYKASWIFYTSPVDKPGQIVLGALKAVLLKFYFPVAAFISTISILFIGVQIIPNLLLALSNVVMIVSVLMFFDKHHFPFSTAQSNNDRAGSFMKGFFLLLISGCVAVAHFFIATFPAAVILCTVLSFILVWYLFGSLRQLSWQKVLSAYTD